MKRVARVFKSVQESEKADRDYYMSLTPQERMRVLTQLMDDYYGPQPRLERVLRVVRLKQS